MTLPVEQTGLPRCANCGVEIPWRPATYRGRTYCCGGCVQGGPCYCSYDLASLQRPIGVPRDSAAAPPDRQRLTGASERRALGELHRASGRRIRS